jgi:hypothetical protein
MNWAKFSMETAVFDIPVPDAALGVLVIAVGMLYSAWHDYKSDNPRDARWLAALGTVGLMGGTMAYFQ